MKTADKMKCAILEKPNEENICISGNALVEDQKNNNGSLSGANFDDRRHFIKTFGGNYIQLDEKSKWSYHSETFKTLVDNANDGICIVFENMRHAYFNRKYCEITGYNYSELKNIGMLDLISAEERLVINKIYQLLFNNNTEKVKNCISTMIRKDGKRCSIECSRYRITWQGKAAVQAIIRDVTEKLEKEKKIEEANKLLNNQIANITAELFSSSEELKQKQSELIRHKFELENVNKELLQTNRAMSFLAQNIVKKKREVEQHIALTVITKIMPVINDLKKKKSIQKYIAELEVLSAYVKGLAPEEDQYNKILVNLSATEMRVATLIKNGMSSQNIADALNISLETVKTHRKKIRKKLEIKNSCTNLTSYLRSMMDDF